MSADKDNGSSTMLYRKLRAKLESPESFSNRDASRNCTLRMNLLYNLHVILNYNEQGLVLLKYTRRSSDFFFRSSLNTYNQSPIDVMVITNELGTAPRISQQALSLSC
jgi:hypothetical protein